MPPSIDVNLKNSTKSFPPARKLIFEDHIKSTKNELEDTHNHLCGTSRSLREQCHPRQLDIPRDVAKSQANCIAASHAVISRRKIKNQWTENPWYKFNNRQNVYNKSRNRTLTDNESILIGLGHGFNTEADRNNVIKTVDAFEYFFAKTNLTDH